ncbi:MAG: hypothetical protein COB02_08340 [Candidatus Cloacimonadota bacterium]|nr:MAG: hypothetical protein COB02_08340 [Candidatus Cloacimonadota bacterium]
MCIGSNIDKIGQQSLIKEFKKMNQLYLSLSDRFSFQFLSMGMSSDYALAQQHGSNMVRIGSLLFGRRL